MRSLFLFIGLILLFGACESSAQIEAWVARYNGPGNSSDEATALTVDVSGNVYVTGRGSSVSGNDNFTTIKYSSVGETLWVRSYNGMGNDADWANAIAVDNSGNVYVTGGSRGSGTASDYATIKYNSNGDTLWVRRYNGPGNDVDEPSVLEVDDSGNVYVTGRSWGSGTASDYATIKYNSNGDTLWIRRYHGSGNGGEWAHALTVDGSGNVYVTGGSDGGGTLGDYATIKYSSSGDTLWVRRYNGPGNGSDVGYALAVDGSGNVYVTGSSMGSGTIFDCATIKYNSNGDTLWVRRYNGPGNDEDWGEDLHVDDAGNVYVAGESIGSGTHYDFATIKYNSNGDTLWVRRYNGPEIFFDHLTALSVNGSGDVYVTGSINSGTIKDYATIKYSGIGDFLWVRTYYGPGDGWDGASAISSDDFGNVYVTGKSIGTGTAYDYATIKYSPMVGMEEDENIEYRTPNFEFRLMQNYPNPFNKLTAISYIIPAYSSKHSAISEKNSVKLAIYDISGRLVETLVNEMQEPGVYQLPITSHQLPSSGIYFYRLVVSDFTSTKKLILLK
jgi:hypothetical protein